MTARKSTRRRAPGPKKCPDCTGVGETSETVRVGVRKNRPTDDHQTALCLSCLGTGLAPEK